ncbi:MAG: hypothetical protein ACEPOW_01985 [Bacteroidales bacterium]
MNQDKLSKSYLLIPLLGLIISFVFSVLWITPHSEHSVRFCLRSTALVSWVFYMIAFLSAAAPKIFKNSFGKKWRRIGIFFFWGFIASHTVHLTNIYYLVDVYYGGDPTHLSNYFPKMGYIFIYVMFLMSLKPVQNVLGQKLCAEFLSFAVYYIMFAFTYGLFDITTASFNLIQFILYLITWIVIFIRGFSKPGFDNIKVRQTDNVILPW